MKGKWIHTLDRRYIWIQLYIYILLSDCKPEDTKKEGINTETWDTYPRKRPHKEKIVFVFICNGLELQAMWCRQNSLSASLVQLIRYRKENVSVVIYALSSVQKDLFSVFHNVGFLLLAALLLPYFLTSHLHQVQEKLHLYKKQISFSIKPFIRYRRAARSDCQLLQTSDM